jgi:hypothetical protein
LARGPVSTGVEKGENRVCPRSPPSQSDLAFSVPHGQGPEHSEQLIFLAGPMRGTFRSWRVTGEPGPTAREGSGREFIHESFIKALETNRAPTNPLPFPFKLITCPLCPLLQWLTTELPRPSWPLRPLKRPPHPSWLPLTPTAPTSPQRRRPVAPSCWRHHVRCWCPPAPAGDHPALLPAPVAPGKHIFCMWFHAHGHGLARAGVTWLRDGHAHDPHAADGAHVHGAHAGNKLNTLPLSSTYVCVAAACGLAGASLHLCAGLCLPCFRQASKFSYREILRLAEAASDHLSCTASSPISPGTASAP